MTLKLIEESRSRKTFLKLIRKSLRREVSQLELGEELLVVKSRRR
jgi:hypothetical protein